MGASAGIWRPQGHWYEVNHVWSLGGRRTFQRRGGLALEIVRGPRRARLVGDGAGLAGQDQIGRQRDDLLGGNAGSDDVVTGGGAQPMLLLAKGEYPGDRMEAGAQQVGQRDVKGVTVGLCGDVQAQRLRR
jgi:hypothetical protein